MRAWSVTTLVVCCLVTVSVATHPRQQQPVPPADPRWQLTFPHPLGGKYEDFAVGGSNDAWLINANGEVIHSADAGKTWAVQATGLGRLRSLDFIDAKRGFAGTLTGVLHQTVDGGATWQDITPTLPRPPQGFCGITHIGDIVHTVGRYYGEVTDHYVSRDGGKTWRFQDLSALAQALVEVVFLDDKVGFIGGMAKGTVNGSPAIILQTRDGGETWRPVFQHDGGRGFAWKIFPVTKKLIYTALQSQDGIYRVAKSVDSGDTWEVLTVATGQPMGPAVQGIGFLDENHGFIGGFFEGLWETTDGGKTWAMLTLGSRDRTVNRFEIVGKTLTTAARSGVWAFKEK